MPIHSSIVSYHFPVTGKKGLHDKDCATEVSFCVCFGLHGQAGVLMEQLAKHFNSLHRCQGLFDFLHGKYSMRFLSWTARNLQACGLPGAPNLSQSFRRTCDAFTKRNFDFFHRRRGETDVVVNIHKHTHFTTCLAQMNCVRWALTSGFHEFVVRHEQELLRQYRRYHAACHTSRSAKADEKTHLNVSEHCSNVSPGYASSHGISFRAQTNSLHQK